VKGGGGGEGVFLHLLEHGWLGHEVPSTKREANREQGEQGKRLYRQGKGFSPFVRRPLTLRLSLHLAHLLVGLQCGADEIKLGEFLSLNLHLACCRLYKFVFKFSSH
jgi:hypothetical protein